MRKQLASHWLQTLPASLQTVQCIGNESLLEQKKIAIVGSRKALSYSKHQTQLLAQMIAARGGTVISGAAIGIDAIAHQGAGAASTIAVLPCGIEVRYPKVNRKLIDDIAANGLLLSSFAADFTATPWSFVVRNELIVALSDAVVLMQADLQSGTMRSAEFARKHQKPLYVLSHRVGESLGTQSLLKRGDAKLLIESDAFCQEMELVEEKKSVCERSEFEQFCQDGAPYEAVANAFAQELFEAELQGRVEILDGKVYLR